MFTRGPSRRITEGRTVSAIRPAVSATMIPATPIDHRKLILNTVSDPAAAATVSALKNTVRPAVRIVTRMAASGARPLAISSRKRDTMNREASIASPRPMPVARFSAKIETGCVAATPRKTRNDPRITMPPTSGGSSAAITPRNTHRDRRKRIGNASSSARARSPVMSRFSWWLMAANPPSFTLGSLFSASASRVAPSTASWSLICFQYPTTIVLLPSRATIDGSCVW